MDRSRIGVPVGGLLAALVLSGCIAGTSPEVVGGIGVAVDEQERPVIVVEPCSEVTPTVMVVEGREGLAPSQTNEPVGSWTATTPVSTTTELALHDPGSRWDGDPVELKGARTYVADGTAGGSTSFGQVAFRYAALADLEPGMVYVGTTGSDAPELVPLSPEEFAARACGAS